MELFDAHAHLAPNPEAIGRLLGVMGGLEIARAAVVAGGSLFPETLTRQMLFGGGTNVSINNIGLLEICQPYSDRLFPFYFANPHLPPDEYAALGKNFHGLKLGPAVHGIPLEDPRNESYVEIASRLRRPVYLHCLSREGFATDSLVRLATRFSNVTFILGHAGIGNCDFWSLPLIAPIPNIYLETSGGFTGVIQRACELLGSKRVLFGSEYPLQHPRAEIEKLKTLNVDQGALADILSHNVRRILEGEDNG